MPPFGTPTSTPARNPFSETQLKSLLKDDLYWKNTDPDFKPFRRMADRAFANAFPGERKFDATGRGIDVTAKVTDPSSFKIKPLSLTAPVGKNASNRGEDVRKASDAFKTLGLLGGDFENKDKALPELTSAIRGFQNMFGLKRDGLMNPGGETVRELTRAFGAPGAGLGGQKKATISSPVGSKPARAERQEDTDRATRLKPAAVTPQPPKSDEKAASLNKQIKDKPWLKSSINSEFLTAIHDRESKGGKNNGYAAEASNGKAFGRYQMTEIALQDVGVMDANKKWTGKHGIHNKEEFLENPAAQEKVMADYMARNQAQLENKGALKNIGQKIDGVEAEITLTQSSLLAAAHRKGAGAVNAYLNHQKKNGWVSDPDGFPSDRKEKFLAIETRLREFQNISHRKREIPSM